MNPINQGARRIILRGNFEFFSQGEATDARLPMKRLEDDLPPAHAFFTSFAARPVLMTYGLRILIPLRDRNHGRRGLVHDLPRPTIAKRPL